MILKEDDHVVRVLRRLGRAREGGDAEMELIPLLAGMHHQYHVDVLLRGKASEFLHRHVHLIKTVKASFTSPPSPFPAPYGRHELEIVQHHQLRIMHIGAVLHRIHHLLHESWVYRWGPSYRFFRTSR